MDDKAPPPWCPSCLVLPQRRSRLCQVKVEPDLLDEAPRWQADDFWQYALLAARANVRAAADPAGVPVREACGALSDKPR